MDILLSNFVNKYINVLDESTLLELEIFLNFEDEAILNFYQQKLNVDNIDENKISKLFKEFKI
jgi:succinate dehydrogenase flavin-adding protein (antitoxin of CptAB toxin-antitoxin module)